MSDVANKNPSRILIKGIVIGFVVLVLWFMGWHFYLVSDCARTNCNPGVACCGESHVDIISILLKLTFILFPTLLIWLTTYIIYRRRLKKMRE